MSIPCTVLRRSTRPGLSSAGRQASCCWPICNSICFRCQHLKSKSVDGKFRLVDIEAITSVTPSSLKAGSSQGQASRTFSRAVGCTLGDVLAQALSGETANAMHSLQLAIYGTLLAAPYVSAAATSTNVSVSSTKHSAATQRAAAAAADPLWMPAMICLLAVLIKLLPSQSDLMLSSCQDKLLSLAAANYILWPLTCYMNANLVPEQHQAKSNLLIHMIWSACLAGVGHTPCITTLPIKEPLLHAGQAAVGIISQVLLQQAASAAIEVLGPVADYAAGAIGVAVRKLDTIPSTLTQEALSKSLKVIMNVEEMAKSPLHLNAGTACPDINLSR